MKLQDILTSDELAELKAIKPVNNVIKAPKHIYQKIQKAKRAGNLISLKSIQEGK